MDLRLNNNSLKSCWRMIKLISFVFQLALQQLCSRGVSVRTSARRARSFSVQNLPSERCDFGRWDESENCMKTFKWVLWAWIIFHPIPPSLFVLSLISQWKQMIYVQSSLWSLCVIPIRSVGPRARLRTLWVFIETADCLLENTKHYSVGMQSPTGSQSIPYLQHSHMSDEYYPLQ